MASTASRTPASARRFSLGVRAGCSERLRLALERVRVRFEDEALVDHDVARVADRHEGGAPPRSSARARPRWPSSACRGRPPARRRWLLRLASYGNMLSGCSSAMIFLVSGEAVSSQAASGGSTPPPPRIAVATRIAVHGPELQLGAGDLLLEGVEALAADQVPNVREQHEDEQDERHLSSTSAGEGWPDFLRPSRGREIELVAGRALGAYCPFSRLSAVICVFNVSLRSPKLRLITAGRCILQV